MRREDSRVRAKKGSAARTADPESGVAERAGFEPAAGRAEAAKVVVAIGTRMRLTQWLSMGVRQADFSRDYVP